MAAYKSELWCRIMALYDTPSNDQAQSVQETTVGESKAPVPSMTDNQPFELPIGMQPPKTKTSIQPFDPPTKPVQDEAVWATLDRSWQNLCPANVHGMKCPGFSYCDKTWVCTNMRPHPHDLAGSKEPCRLPASQHRSATCCSLRVDDSHRPCPGRGTCYSTRHAHPNERVQLEIERPVHVAWVIWRRRAGNPLP